MADVGISVVVVNWNAGAALLRCIETIEAHPPSEPVEVVVVDNASTDGSAEDARARHPGITVLANPANVGLAAANNQGIAATTGRYILIANPDIEVTAGALDALVAFLDRHPRAAWVVPRLRRPDGSLQTAVGDLPTLGEALLGRSWQRIRPRRRDRGFWWDGWPHTEASAVGHAMEACYLVRRAAIDAIGPQDPGYPLDWEGIDWAARAGDAGWEVWFCPDAEVVHVGGVSLRQVPLRWVIGSHRGMYRYFASRSPRWKRPAIAAAIGVRGLVKATAVAVGAWRYDSVPADDP